MTELQGYRTPAAVSSAIAAAAKRANTFDDSLSVDEYMRLEYFNRFLSRVFHDQRDTSWVLKGGTSMLARVATARATRDVDLYHQGPSLEASVAELRRLAAIDLGDFFRFEYRDRAPSLNGAWSGSVEGCTVRFDVYLGAKKLTALKVDLARNVVVTGDIDPAVPASALDIPKLVSNPYRLYPVVDQIADKVCATVSRYGQQSSSREKDLVDLVILANTVTVGASQLEVALRTEAVARGLQLSTRFELPESWGRVYEAEASRIPACAAHRTIHAAAALMAKFIDPVMNGDVRNEMWHPETLQWEYPNNTISR